jgi:hypothetical protein
MSGRIALLILVGALASGALAQVPAQAPPMQGGIQSGDLAQLNNTLSRLQETAQEANIAIAKMRIDKWKVDGDTKKQAQANSESLQRNLTAALPEMIGKVRNSPQDLSANFKLYRNLNAVYDVFASVAESAGAFGPKDQYEPLAQQVSAFDSARRMLADRIDQLAAAKEMELVRFRQAEQLARQQQQAAPPKKIIVDDTAPAKPKKKKPKAAANPQ